MPVVSIAVNAPSATDGLRYESHSVFTLDLAAKAVHVRVAISVTNQKPSYTSGGFINQFYFPRIAIPVLSEASNFVATRDTGASLNVTSEGTDSPQVSVALVDLKPALYYPQSQNIEFDYDLPGQPPRAPGITRINDAFSSFVAFGHGDAGLTTVEINVPSSLTTEIVGVDMKRQVNGVVTTYTADALDNPDTWTAAVDAHDDAHLVLKDESVDGEHITIKGWPDDPQWVDFVDGQLKNGLPAMEKLIGQPWPSSAKDLTVTETAAPYLYGYAGWYNPLKNSIDIGDALDAIVVLHEISHTWFNRDLFTERWINEAFANEFAARALEKIGQPLQSAEAVTPDSPAAFKLDDWGTPKLQDSSTTEQEHFGYNASWQLLRAISTEIGMDKLTKVVNAAAHQQLAYQTATSNDTATKTVDSRALLDLLEEQGGSKQAVALFTQYVLTPAESASLPLRDDARAAYHRFLDGSGGWGAPLRIRAELGSWDFSQTDLLIPEAQRILKTRDEIADTLRPLGLSVPAALQKDYESAAELDLHTVADEANHDLDAAHHLVDANAAVHGSHGIIGTFGLLFSGNNDTFHKAESAFSSGDATKAINLADRARSQAKDATKAGMIRLVVILLVIATAYALWTWGRPFARRTLEARAEKTRAQLPPPPAPASWPDWMPPPPPYYPPSPPAIAPPDPPYGGPRTQQGDED